MTQRPPGRALVTGAAGVIGRQLTRRLADAGVELLTIDRSPMPDGFANLSRHIQDDLALMSYDEVIEFDAQHVYHLAASFERTTESPEYWDIGWRDDVTASHQTISATTDCPSLTTFVFASSYLVYDEVLYLTNEPPRDGSALQESARVDPRNLCGAGKYYTERELRYTVDVKRPDIRVCNARIFRVYGQGSRDIVSRWARALLDRAPIEVFNASNVFDYVYANDVAEALARLAGAPAASGVFNVGTGRGTRISEVVDALRIAGPGMDDLVSNVADQGPYEASVADVSRLSEVLGWVPGTGIVEGVRNVLEHERA